MLDQTNNLILEQALKYAQLNISVIPVGINKRPLIKWQKYQRVRATEEEIRQWWTTYPDAQLAIVTGSISRIVVVDVDIKDDKYHDPSTLNLPQTTVVRSGSGGFHYYYTLKQPVPNKARINDLDIDIRAEGGYIIAPPSHNEKGEYTFVSKTVTMPDFPMSFIKDKDAQPESPYSALKKTSHTTENSYANFTGISEGGRNHGMAAYIGSLITKIHPQEWENIAWPQVEQANTLNSPPLNPRELRTTFDSMCSKERSSGADRFHNKKQPTKLTKTEDKPPLSIMPLNTLLSLPQIDSQDVISKMIPSEAITAITAETGIGKSVLVWEMARYIATGEPFLGQEEFKTKRSRVLIVDQEMSEKEIRRRSNAIFRDHPNAEIFFMKGQNFKIDDEKTYNELVALIKQHGIGTLILDTFSTIHTQEESSRDGMMQVNEKMMEIINETGCAIVYIHHHRKQQEGSSYGNDSARGSSEIMAKVSSHLLFRKKGTPNEYDDENGDLTIERKFILSQKKSRGVDGFDSILIKSLYNYDKEKTSWEFIEKTTERKVSSEKASDLVIGFLEERKGAEWSTADITSSIAENGVGVKNTSQALKDLRYESLVIYRKEKNKYFYKYKEPEVIKELSNDEISNQINLSL